MISYHAFLQGRENSIEPEQIGVFDKFSVRLRWSDDGQMEVLPST